MRYYIRFDVDVEGKGSASLHLSGVSTCTFQGGRGDLPPQILVDWLHSCFCFGISLSICSVGSSAFIIQIILV